MFRYLLIILGVTFVCGSGEDNERDNKRIERRLGFLEDFIAEERLQRREDVKTIMNKLSGLENILQKTLGSKMVDNVDHDKQAHDDIAGKVSGKIIKRVARGFADEKRLNARFRREIESKLRHQMNICSPIPEIMRKLQAMEDRVGDINITVSTELNKYHTISRQNFATKSDLADVKKVITDGQYRLSNNISKIITFNTRSLEPPKYENCSPENTIYNITQPISDKEVKNDDKNKEIEESNIKNGNRIQYGSCKELLAAGHTSSSVYKITIKDRNVDVYCDQTTDGGGWIVFQRRQDGSEDFSRNWNDYKQGFGDLRGEFWLGNDNMADLTESCCHDLRVDIADFDGNIGHAKYSDFRVLNESSLYKLKVGSYSGDAGDALSHHNDMKFSTKDSDNDASSGSVCTDLYPGAWWFRECYKAHLNGVYYRGGRREFKGLHWLLWRKLKGRSYSLRFSEMKFRKV